MSTSVEKREAQTPSLVRQINQVMPQLERLGVDPDRFARTLITEANKNPQLLQCTPHSFMSAAFASAQLGLEPGPLNQVWLIPRKNKRRGTVEAQFMLGYQGMVELARRVGVIVTAKTVHENDHFEERLGSDAYLDHRRNYTDPGEPILWYAKAEFPDGRVIWRVLPKAEIEKRRKASSTPYKPGAPWYDWYDAMARKTAIRALWSELPADPMLQEAQRHDEQVLDVPALRPTAGDRAEAPRPAIEVVADQAAEDQGESTSGSSHLREEPETGSAEPTLHELRDRCRALGLSRQGTRDELIARIRDAEAAEDVDGQVEAEGRDDVPPMPPPPNEPADAPPAAAGDEDLPPAGDLRDRMVAALRTIGGNHARYADVWHRMVAIVPEHRLEDTWEGADQAALAALVAEVEQLAAEVEADA